jgi:protease-4
MSATRQVSFWKIFFASLFALVAATILFWLVFFAIIGSSFKQEPFSVQEKSILHITLEEPIMETTGGEFNPNSFSFDKQLGIHDVLIALDEAAKDDNISGIFIDINSAPMGFSTLHEFRNGLERFKESGKFIMAYNSGESISQKALLLSSVADENYIFPSTMVEFLGLGAELMFFKNMLDKLDIEMQVVRGEGNDFKSAVEPFFLDKMSDSSRMQMQRILDVLWTEYKDVLGKSRNLKPNYLDSLAQNALIRRGTHAVDYKLVDGTKYYDEILSLLKEKTGIEKDDDLELVSFYKYVSKKADDKKVLDEVNEPNIAVLVAAGDISVDGEGIASNKLVKEIRDIRENDDIKALVFRVNSPGGSALASDEIWRELSLLAEKKKLIVSMGDVAASGGYYISAPAHRIFAQRSTITGSIGVFGVIPYTGKMFSDKLGITFDYVNTNDHANFSLNRKMSDTEKNIIQDEVNAIYYDFLNIVAKGRKLDLAKVKTLAKGRVWMGEDALEIGLVDELGGIRDAMAYAAKLAKIEKPVYDYYPKQERNKFNEILMAISEDEETRAKINDRRPSAEILRMMEIIKTADQIQGVQMRLPFMFDIR